MSGLDRILAEAEAMMRRKVAAHMHRAYKDGARAILAGQPCLNVRARPQLIAQRYIRFLAYLRRTRLRLH